MNDARAAHQDGWVRASRALSLLTVALPALVLTWSWWTHPDLYGFHDWDVQASHRFLARESIARWGELPSWNPYACGGFPAWGYVESGTIVVSPLLPVYLLFDLRIAMRVEMTAMAIVGAVGCFRLAGKLSPWPAARALAVALWATNGRFGLQLAAGHTWHLAYALLPWALDFYASALDRRGAPGRRAVLGLGATLAALVYSGGIYPLPHAALALALWACGAAVARRSARPLARLAAGAATGVGLAAPKLLPMLATFGRAPRLIESSETMSLGALWVALTSRAQGFFDRPVRIAPYGWHEWGLYVSLVGALALALGTAWALAQGGARPTRARGVALLALVFGGLGLGAFAPWAPWTLLHAHVPVFRSHHVPSRFLYPAVLFAGLCAAGLLGALLERFARARPWIGCAAAALALGVALDVTRVAAKPMQDAIWMEAPDRIERAEVFHHVREPPLAYKRRDWAGPMYLAMRANKGVLRCYGAPPFEGQGALAQDDRRYKGEVWLEPPSPDVEPPRLARWSPSRAEVALGAPVAAGSALVYNMNYDPGWGARAEREGAWEDAVVVRRDDRVAVLLPAGTTRVALAYRPPGLGTGLALCALTALAWLVAARARALRRLRALWLRLAALRFTGS